MLSKGLNNEVSVKTPKAAIPLMATWLQNQVSPHRLPYFNFKLYNTEKNAYSLIEKLVLASVDSVALQNSILLVCSAESD